MAKYPDQKHNMNPHAEARMAWWLWGDEYAAQRGGIMDFWNGLSENRKQIATDAVNDVVDTIAQNGRAHVLERD